jgi:hypothetical protein
MDSKIANQDTGLRVQIDGSRTRTAPKTDFGSMVGTGLSKSANAVMDAGALAAPFIPGGAVLSAAITGVGSLKASAAAQTTTASGSNSTSLLASTGVSSDTSSTVSASSTLSDTQLSGDTGDMMSQMQQFSEMNMSFNMQYLALQQKMQSDNRQFTSLSNIMKTKHDAAKNAINNVR